MEVRAVRREQVMRNCACGVGVHCVSRETRGGGCGAGRFLRHGHASRHSPALEGKRQEKRASDVRLAGCDYVVAWLPGARFLGARRGGHRPRRALRGAWLRRGAETTPVARVWMGDHGFVLEVWNVLGESAIGDASASLVDVYGDILLSLGLIVFESCASCGIVS